MAVEVRPVTGLWATVVISLLSQASALGFRQNASSVLSDHPLHGFGTRRYQDSFPLPTWGHLTSGEEGSLGVVCDPETPEVACGKELVCRQGVCRHCTADRECPSLHRCTGKRLGRPRQCVAVRLYAWERVLTNPSELLCTLLIFIAAALAAAAGTGGGGIFVPLLVTLAGLKASSAVPISQCMIFSSSIVNLTAFLAQRHPAQPERTKIDYDCVALFEPMLCLGVTLGVLVHQTAPQWLLLVLLVVTLSIALWRTGDKGLRQLRAEAKQSSRPFRFPSRRELLQGIQRDDSSSYFEEVSHNLYLNMVPMLAAMGVWLLMLLASFQQMGTCTVGFAVFLLFLVAMLALCTMAYSRYLLRDHVEPEVATTGTEDAAWTLRSSSSREVYQMILVAFGAGFLGGLLGLGGGVVVSPVLLEVGMHSEAVQATTAVFVFLSSSLATTQFAILGHHIWHYALWYSGVAVLGTLLGLLVSEAFVRVNRRYSMITLAIAGVLLASLVALTMVGIREVVSDIVYGQQLGFSTSQLCGRDQLRIITVDVLPSQPLNLP
mmetsp:Transcript_761/g.1832  ORF Transcript_761/g.1832 Transcript_761/m.1832 type:complete len:548 (+) Transcript_761:48-1691(+)